MPLRASGELKLVLLCEADGKKLRTVTAVNVRVTPDRPPWFEEVAGIGPRPRTARPGSRVPVAVVAGDDVGVSAIVLEYTLDPTAGRIESLPMPPAAGSPPRAAGRLDLDATSLARGAPRLLFRVRVTDNRSPAEPALGPQTALYPPTGWSELRFSATAAPLKEQDVLNQRDTVRDAVAAARLAVRDAAETVAPVRTGPPADPLPPEDAVRLSNALGLIRRTIAALHDTADEAALTPELRPLASALRGIADRELRTAEAAVGRAEGDEPGRADAIAVALRSLDTAGDELNAVLARNAALARDRLDRARLGALAADQADLARNAPGAEFADRQRERLARLGEIVADSGPLRLAIAGARGAEAHRLAGAIAELSEDLRALDDATRGTAAGTRAALAGDAARDQAALADRAARLFAVLDTANRLAGTTPPRLEDFRRAPALAALGRTVDALTELEKQAQALEWIAAEFEAWADDHADPKKAARHLALWQDDLLTRVRTAIGAAAPNRLPDGTRAALLAEQTALRDALARLHLPPDDVVRAARDGALLHAGTARALLAGDGRDASAAMKRAVDALNRLADLTPPVAERLAKALRDFERFRSDQDAVTNAVDQVLRGTDAPAGTAVEKRLGPLAERQRAFGPAVAALDAPGLEARQARVVGAVARAAADLRDGLPFDALASQLLVRREFERLKLALEGTTPPDQKVTELFHRITALAAELDRHGSDLTTTHLEPAGPAVQEVLRQLPPLAPEAPALLSDTRTALQWAETGFRDGSQPDEVRRRVRTAVGALEQLVARLTGTETELGGVQRLAGYRRLGAARAKELAEARAPFSAAASGEALRQLARESDELTHTRVGPTGQLHKKRALDLYARLRTQPEPDRLRSDQRALADALDELAAKMADVTELTTVPALPEPAPADTYLPSRPRADALRELAREQRALRDRLANSPKALADRLRPAPVNPFPGLEAEQRGLAAELLALAPEAAAAAGTAADRLQSGSVPLAKEAAEVALVLTDRLADAGGPWGAAVAALATRQRVLVTELANLSGTTSAATAQQVARAAELADRATATADALDRAAKAQVPRDATAEALAGAVEPLRDAAGRLREAGQRLGAADTIAAARLRSAAAEHLRTAHARMSTAAPAAPVTSAARGEVIRAAELAMRAALDAPKNAAAAAERAARALREAADLHSEPTERADVVR